MRKTKIANVNYPKSVFNNIKVSQGIEVTGIKICVCGYWFVFTSTLVKLVISLMRR